MEQDLKPNLEEILRKLSDKVERIERNLDQIGPLVARIEKLMQRIAGHGYDSHG